MERFLIGETTLCTCWYQSSCTFLCLLVSIVLYLNFIESQIKVPLSSVFCNCTFYETYKDQWIILLLVLPRVLSTFLIIFNPKEYNTVTMFDKTIWGYYRLIVTMHTRVLKHFFFITMVFIYLRYKATFLTIYLDCMAKRRIDSISYQCQEPPKDEVERNSCTCCVYTRSGIFTACLSNHGHIRNHIASLYLNAWSFGHRKKSMLLMIVYKWFVTLLRSLWSVTRYSSTLCTHVRQSPPKQHIYFLVLSNRW